MYLAYVARVCVCAYARMRVCAYVRMCDYAYGMRRRCATDYTHHARMRASSAQHMRAVIAARAPHIPIAAYVCVSGIFLRGMPTCGALRERPPHVYMNVFMCVCVCVFARKRVRKRLCVCAYACAYARADTSARTIRAACNPPVRRAHAALPAPCMQTALHMRITCAPHARCIHAT
jgi:hypothetical protein